jgi:hypothetical protein
LLVEFALVEKIWSSLVERLAGRPIDEVITLAAQAMVLGRFVLISPMPREEKPARRHCPMQI